MENDRHVTAIDPVVERMVAFLGTIGLPVSLDRIGERTVVPGILIDRGVIVVDESQLAYPGDQMCIRDSRGATDRIHLVIDCVLNDWLRDLILAESARAVPA